MAKKARKKKPSEWRIEVRGSNVCVCDKDGRVQGKYGSREAAQKAIDALDKGRTVNRAG